MDSKEIRAMLATGWVNIIFTKITTGERRNCVATTNLDLIPEENHPKGKPHWEKENYVRFYDLSVQNWRCLRTDMIEDASMNTVLNR